MKPGKQENTETGFLDTRVISSSGLFPELKLRHYPHAVAATLAALPSMSLIPFSPFLLS